jgi:hypothetical protein
LWSSIPYTLEAWEDGRMPVIIRTVNCRQQGSAGHRREQDPETDQAEHQRPGEQVADRRKTTLAAASSSHRSGRRRSAKDPIRVRKAAAVA